MTFQILFESQTFSEDETCKDPKNLMVRCGEWDLKNEDELIVHQDRAVDSISIHPAYSYNKLLEYDYAILHVTEDFNMLEENVGAICLPENPNQREGMFQKKPIVLFLDDTHFIIHRAIWYQLHSFWIWW